MIIVQLIGGLGNQMFQYACGRHLAILNNTELVLDLSFLENRTPFRKDFVFRNFDLDLLNVQARIATNEDIPLYPPNLKIDSIPHRLHNLFKIRLKGYQYILERKWNLKIDIQFKPKVLKLRGNVYLAGYWPSTKYFQAIEDTIRNDFTFKKGLSTNCLGVQNEIKSCNSVCINVRRTDFLTNTDIGFHGLDYIETAIKELTRRTKDVVFYIFSDDIAWCRKSIKLEYTHFFKGEEFYGERFADYFQLMSSCKHFIIPNSTFAWWAAWLSTNKDKIVIVPDNYFAHLDTRDMIPEDWIRI